LRVRHYWHMMHLNHHHSTVLWATAFFFNTMIGLLNASTKAGNLHRECCALFFILWSVTSAATEQEPPAATLIPRTTSSVDILVCVQGSLLTTLRSAFQTTLVKYLRDRILEDTAVYLERQYTALVSGDLCYLYVYQAPNPQYSIYAAERLTTKLNEKNQLLLVPFTIPSTDSTVEIQCKVDAAQWSGDDLTLLGAPLPGLWTVNDMLLWGSCLLSVLFLCMATLCCYALCTKVSPFKDHSAEDEESKILKMDKEILTVLTAQKNAHHHHEAGGSNHHILHAKMQQPSNSGKARDHKK
jgi:hypothetical protein